MTYLAWTQLFLLVAGAQVTPGKASEGITSGVQLRSHSATWEDDALHFEVEVANGLPEAVTSLEIGVVYAASREALKGLAPVMLYPPDRRLFSGEGVVAIRERVAVSLGAGESRRIEFQRPLAGKGGVEGGVPAAFVSHLLGYTLKDVSAAGLLRLLNTRAAADEWAACNALGLLSEGLSPGDARRVLREDAAFVATLRALLKTPLPSPPPAETAMRWVFGVLALGAHGGDDAAKLLGELRRREDLALLDEEFHVIRLAGLSRSIFETPLAMTFPESVVTVAELVDFSMKRAGAAFVESPASKKAPVAPVAHEWLPGWLAWGVALVSGLALLSGAYSYSKKRGQR
jgi:hypothetical protein